MYSAMSLSCLHSITTSWSGWSVMASLVSSQVPEDPAVPCLFLLLVIFKGRRDPLLLKSFSRSPRVTSLSQVPIPEFVPAPGGWNLFMRPTPGPKMWTALPCRTQIRNRKKIIGFILFCFDKQQIITLVTKTRQYYEEWTQIYLKFSGRSWGPLWHLFLNSRIQTLQPEDTVCIGYSSDRSLPSALPELGTGDTTASKKYTCAKRLGGGWPQHMPKECSSGDRYWKQLMYF